MNAHERITNSRLRKCRRLKVQEITVGGVPGVGIVIEDAGVYVALTSAEDVASVGRALDKLAARLTERRPRSPYSDEILAAIANGEPLTKRMLGT